VEIKDAEQILRPLRRSDKFDVDVFLALLALLGVEGLVEDIEGVDLAKGRAG
jgi:hypothetical protein